MKKWYDGYEFAQYGSVYNPYSVMAAIESDVLKLLSGENIRVNIRNFKNDFRTFTSKDDVFTLLIHLGYLSYDRATERVKIPNEEVKLEFQVFGRVPQFGKS